MQQGRIIFTEFQDEHAKPMEEDTTLFHSIVLMYAHLCTIAVVLTGRNYFKSFCSQSVRFSNPLEYGIRLNIPGLLLSNIHC